MEIVLVLVVILGLIILFKVGGVLLRILLNMILGFLLLFIVDLIPSVDIPINILTVLVAGFGGIFGVIFLLILSFIGII
ncbi:pro-sigmaK processing inhibitor BofA family protein [Methanobacterium aggregans]|uniref:pro-sigmaK processing inhibitor BofA family protein n=1 Tax=Methanobacterium aggregans TaxID=1615586 RepID=UPI001AE57BCA|nr:pro-sigmaK processing inhibitor BofA family protein [Methanobacterium aggregans]MBP2046417.1 inhibitor of the pro-sigma K processing machinery [Methanobacterium aggregans]